MPTMKDYRDAAKDVIEGLTPKQMPHIKFRRASDNEKLERLPLSASPDTDSRVFQFLATTRGELVVAHGCKLTTQRRFHQLSIRYIVPMGRDGEERYQDFIDDDIIDIIGAFSAHSWNATTPVYAVKPFSDREDEIDDNFRIVRLTFRSLLRHSSAT